MRNEEILDENLKQLVYDSEILEEQIKSIVKSLNMLNLNDKALFYLLHRSSGVAVTHVKEVIYALRRFREEYFEPPADQGLGRK